MQFFFSILYSIKKPSFSIRVFLNIEHKYPITVIIRTVTQLAQVPFMHRVYRLHYNSIFMCKTNVCVLFTDNTCHPDYCSNGGSCSPDNYGDLICSCISEWNDALCTGKKYIYITFTKNLSQIPGFKFVICARRVFSSVTLE